MERGQGLRGRTDVVAGGIGADVARPQGHGQPSRMSGNCLYTTDRGTPVDPASCTMTTP